MLGLRFCARAFSSCGKRGPLFITVRGPLTVAASPVARSTGSRRAGSVVVSHGPSCSAACGIFPDQGSNPCALHWQADSQPLRHQGNPSGRVFKGNIRSEGGRVPDQLTDILLIGCCWGCEFQLSVFRLQTVWGPSACGQHAVNFFHLVGVLMSAKQLKDMTQNIIYSPRGGTKCPWLCSWLNYYYFVWQFSFVSAFLWLSLLFGTQERPRRLQLFYKQEAGDIEGSDPAGFLDYKAQGTNSLHCLLVLWFPNPLRISSWKFIFR